MAVDLSNTGTLRQSISRVELITTGTLKDDDRVLNVTFENGYYDNSGNLIGGTVQPGSRFLRRRFGDIKNDVITAAGTSATVAQLAAMIATAVYIYRAQDVG